MTVSLLVLYTYNLTSVHGPRSLTMTLHTRQALDGGADSGARNGCKYAICPPGSVFRFCPFERNRNASRSRPR